METVQFNQEHFNKLRLNVKTAFKRFMNNRTKENSKLWFETREVRDNYIFNR